MNNKSTKEKNIKNIETEHESKHMMTRMLAEYSYERPMKGQFRDAEIVQINEDQILVDLGGKSDAVVPSKEIKKTDESLIAGLSEGDIVPVYVLRPPTLMQKPVVSLQRGVEKADWGRAIKMFETMEIKKLKITGKNKGGLLIEFGRLTGFLPASLTPTISRARNRKMAKKIKANLIDEELFLSVIEVNSNHKRLIFSAKHAKEQIRESIIKNLQAGEVRKGIIVNLVDFGAFIDLFGIVGLLHISEIGWNKPDHPSDVLSLGEKVEVKILKVDEENQQVGLSRKALIDPFDEFTQISESTTQRSS
jgi:small subunit ribosomal protein S1